MKNGIHSLARQKTRHRRRVAGIQFMKPKQSYVALVPPGKIVGDDDVVTSPSQQMSGNRSDVAGAARHHDFGHKLQCKARWLKPWFWYALLDVAPRTTACYTEA
jgi:hypothetical protein